MRIRAPQLAVPLAGAEGAILAASTGARNNAYIQLAPALFAAAASQALAEAGVAPDEVTHVVTVSCTGMFAPGPDFRLVKDLGLPLDVERYHIGFMGCAAALPGLRAASRICAAQPDAVVLVAAAELCTLHIHSSEDPQQIVAASVFADGAAAAVVSNAPRTAGPRLELDRFGTVLTSEGESDMVWTIGDDGFDMVLTAEVPRIIGREIRDAVGRFLGDDAPDRWAVHPGGRSVLDRVETGLSLDPAALEASRSVLRRQGNMSSATILFILRDLLHDESIPDAALIAALAFGPGLTVESALLTRIAAGAGVNLAVRDADVAELMDDPECDPTLLAATLRRFDTVNRLISGWGGVYRSRLRPYLASLGRAARVLDLGCGGGDLPVRLADLARRDGLDVEWLGVDPDPRAIDVAQERAAPGVVFRCTDAATLRAEGERFDVVAVEPRAPPSVGGRTRRVRRRSRSRSRRGSWCIPTSVAAASRTRLYTVGVTPFAPGTFLRTDGLRSIRRSYRGDELAAALGSPWRVEAASPFRVLAVGHARA